MACGPVVCYRVLWYRSSTDTLWDDVFLVLCMCVCVLLRMRRWEDNIRTDLREIGCEGVDWIHIAQERDQ